MAASREHETVGAAGRVVWHCRAGRTESSVHVASRGVPAKSATCNKANLSALGN
jgi:hypothetical protein